MRIRVSVILEILADRVTPGTILADFPDFEPGDISAALRFAAFRVAEGPAFGQGRGMNIELPAGAEAWGRRGIDEGRFASPEDAVLYAIDQAKPGELRREPIAANEEGGGYSADEVHAYALSQLSGAE